MTTLLQKSSSIVTNPEFITPLKPTETGIYVTIHGHFYQPPRENPYLDTIERQPSASPCHDWNERIHLECYRPNAFARILSDRGEILKIVNNFEYLSFNIGPTLMSWLEGYDPETYQRIIEADYQSCDRLNGHGNAIAQVYNHIILPLANKRDKYTQIRWGKADFKYRFGRETEGMWLAETAVDYDTLEALIDENIRFIVLAPSQAERCRPFSLDPDSEWHEVGGAQIDPTRPYRCFIADGRFIDIFFYDGPISRDMGFNDVLSSSDHLAKRLGQAVKGDHRPAQLISVATDGETFGHHKGGTEKCLAYAFTHDFPKRGWIVTNFAHYLSLFPPQWEVVLKPVTAWSCFHGVDRWQDNCGCGGGGEWHQKWRRPLRDSLNWLRDELIKLYLAAGQKLFNDPWQTREDYIQVILNRSPEKIEIFLTHHQLYPLSQTEKIDALRLLEMQRHSLLMFTSCGWFFEEISRPEGVQVLRYASRAMELAAEVTGIHLEDDFVSQLALASSNVEVFKDGEAVYQQLVTTAQISFEQVAAHYAISSLFTHYTHQELVYCYQTEQLDYQKQQLGPLTLAVGQVKLTSVITWESHHFTFAVLHLGGWDFHCCIQLFKSRSVYSKLKEQVFTSLKLASSAKIILSMSEVFGYQSFNLQDLFAEERHRIMQLLTEKTKKYLDQLYTQIYRDNYSILVAFQKDELPVPQELQVAADIAIAHRCLQVIANLEQSINDPQLTANHLEELTAIASEADYLHCQLAIPEAKKTLERLIFQTLKKLLYTPDTQQAEVNIEHLIKMIKIGEYLYLGISLAPAQELYYYFLHPKLISNRLENHTTHSFAWKKDYLSQLLKLGEILAMDVSFIDNLTVKKA